MGLNSWAGFVGTNEKAHVAGDVVMSAKEVNPVIQTFRKGGIEIVAVHNHMLDEQPRSVLSPLLGNRSCGEIGADRASRVRSCKRSDKVRTIEPVLEPRDPDAEVLTFSDLERIEI